MVRTAGHSLSTETVRAPADNRNPARDRISAVDAAVASHKGAERESAIVTDMLASAVEANALSDSVHCLMFMLWPDVRRKPFERRGYQTVVLDPYLAWLQKTLDQGS